MKKLFTYLSVAALMAVACEGMYGPVEAPTAPDQPGTVEIQIDTLGDETFTFTVSSVGDNSYYSYLVSEGPAQAVDSASLYQCNYSGLVKGTCKAADAASKTVTLEGLAPNTPYTIYAVAGSLQGIPGSVVVKEVVTTDQVAIAITNFSAPNDSTVVLSFSEQVFLGEGEVTATYYASVPSVAAMGVVSAESVVVEGNTATVSFAGLPHGAYFAVSYTEGTFTDSANNKIKAFASGYNAEKDAFAGVYSRRETAPVALDAALPEELQMFNDWENTMFYVAADSTLVAAGEGTANVQYVTPGKVTTIDLAYGSTYAIMQGMVVMLCPEAPAYGSNVVFSFEDDAFQDMWGNPTAAAEYSTLCAYDYTLETIVGTYEAAATSYWAGPYSTTITFALSDSEEGNVEITEFLGIECATPIIADFEPTSGLLTISNWQYFADGKDYYYGEDGNPVMGEDGQPILLDVQLYFLTNSGEDVVLHMYEEGVLSAPSDLFGVFEMYGEYEYNYYDMFVDFTAKKVEAAAPAPATQAVKRNYQLRSL